MPYAAGHSFAPQHHIRDVVHQELWFSTNETHKSAVRDPFSSGVTAGPPCAQGRGVLSAGVPVRAAHRGALAAAARAGCAAGAPGISCQAGAQARLQGTAGHGSRGEPYTTCLIHASCMTRDTVAGLQGHPFDYAFK